MAGEGHADAVIGYLSRLTGETVQADQALRLRSIHRAAFSSWVRKNQVPIQWAAMTEGVPFTVRGLLNTDLSGEPHGVTPAAAIAPSRTVAGGTGIGIGIDIEDVDTLPQTDDYREHPFYQDNFTPVEIAYCLRRTDTRSSFCGLWAAKEALLKSGLVSAASDTLKSIEIGHDAQGRPIFPGCSLSISHTPHTAVAVCVVAAVQVLAPPPPAASAVETVIERRKVDPTKRRTVAAACAIVVVVGFVLTVALRAWP